MEYGHYTITNKHPITIDSRKLVFESKVHYYGSSTPNTGNLVDKLIREAAVDCKLDLIKIHTVYDTRATCSLPGLDDKVKAAHYDSDMRIDKLELALPCKRLGTSQWSVATKDGITVNYHYTLAVYHEDPQDTDRFNENIVAEYLIRWQTEFRGLKYQQAINTIRDSHYRKIKPLVPSVLGPNAPLIIERVLFHNWGHVYYQSLCRLIDRYPLWDRLCLGLLLGGIGPGIVWTIGSQMIIFKFCDSLCDYEDDLGYKDYKLFFRTRPTHDH